MKKILYIIISLTLAVSSNGQDVIDKVVAVVGDKAILLSDIQEQLLQAYQQGLPMDHSTECLILEEMLFQKLLTHQAEIDSIEVSDDEVKGELEQRIQYFSSQMPNGIQGLEEFYGKTIAEIKEEFFDQIKSRIMAERMRAKITNNVNVSPKDVRDFYYSFPEDSIPFINSKISVAHLTIEPEITSDEKKQLKDKIEVLRNQIINGELDFESAASFYSEDPGSKNNGGDFGWVTRGDFVPEFDAVAFRIPINQVSEVFESPFGYHICLIDSRRGEQYHGRHILLAFKVSSASLISAKKKLEQIADDIKRKNISWEEAVLKFSNDDQTKGSKGIIYNMSNSSMWWDMKEIDPQLFKGIDELNVGEISVPLYYETQMGKAFRLVKLVGRTEPHKANLKDDYQMIQSYALSEKKATATELWINKKIKGVYVKIDPAYQDCTFNYKWLPIP